jgi:hypothetical protein
MAPALEILGSELAGDFDGFSDRPTGNRTVVGNPHLVAGGITEPQPSNVLDPIVRETQSDSILLAVYGDRADRVLGNSGICCCHS